MISVSLWIMVYRGKGTAIASHVITTDSPNTTFSGVDLRLMTIGIIASVKKLNKLVILYDISYLPTDAFPLIYNPGQKCWGTSLTLTVRNLTPTTIRRQAYLYPPPPFNFWNPVIGELISVWHFQPSRLCSFVMSNRDVL